MPRIVKPLTDSQIKNAKPTSREYNLADGRGLYLRIRPSGTKEWIFNYYKPNSKRRTNNGLGLYPEVTLRLAREKRERFSSILAEGVDPSVHYKQLRGADKRESEKTLSRVTEMWLETRSDITPRYKRDIRSSLVAHIMPKLGEIPINELKPLMAIDALRPLSNQGKHETVSRICARLIRVMTFAKNIGLIEENRLYGIKDAFQAPDRKHLPTLKPAELRAFLVKLAYANITLTTKCLIEWQLHTMVRPGEAAGTKWSEIRIEDALWVIPALRMKKNKAHSVPLTKHCLFLLSVMRPISGHLEYVFPADRNPKHHASSQAANVAIKRMGYKNKLVAHGLRSLASTTLNEQGFRPDIIEVALAHGDLDKVRESYNHAEFLTQRREMMDWWSSHIEASISKKERADGINEI